MTRNVLISLALIGAALALVTDLGPQAAHAQQAAEQQAAPASAGAEADERPRRVFPPGLGIGLVPPEDMVPSQRFPGFEDPDREAAIMMSELPPELFASMEKDLRDPAEEPEGFKLISREAWPVEGGKGLLVAASHMVDGETIHKWVLARGTSASSSAITFQVSEKGLDHYTDEVVRRTLRSVALRDHAELMEEVEQLPFVVDETIDDDSADDHTGFRIARIIPGSSVMLTDGPKDLVQGAEQPVIVVGSGRAAIVGKLEQDQFGRQSFAGVAGVRGMQVRRAEGVTVDGVEWHEIEAEGQDSGTGAKVRVFQAIRFEHSDFVRFVMVARDDAHERAQRFFERLRRSVTLRPAAASGDAPADTTAPR